MRGIALVTFCLGLHACASPPEPVGAPRPIGGHSHNDYTRRRPLVDALENGMVSVEADVFLVDGELLVGHERSALRAGRTLESMYLDPLLRRFQARGDSEREGAAPLTLLVDIKADGAAMWPHLRVVLMRYAPMLTVFRDDGTRAGAVSIVLSGDRPRRLVANDAERLCAIDGRPADLETDPSPNLVPLISDAWNNHFEWKGFGEMPTEERERFATLVARAHAQGRRVRVWGAPDTPNAWRVQCELGVDLLNTDRPAELAKFLREAMPTHAGESQNR